MPEPSISRVSEAATGRQAVRIVLFGRTDAGKSSLLGALAQAAQTQEHALNGRLTDLSHGLAELQWRLYEEEPQGTPQEIVLYPVTFQPFPAHGSAAKAKLLHAVLIDCDGHVANRLLGRQQTLEGPEGDGRLAQALVEADALVLAVDVSADWLQVDTDFGQFERFLRLLELGRGQLVEVSGQPVFLALTKCDLLVKPGEKSVTFADWVERLEEEKRKVAGRFQEFLARHQREEPSPFGRLELQPLWATAVRRPALDDSPARPREPYGVAELFRQCFHDARVFQTRQLRSNRWLAGIVAGSLGLAATFLGLGILFLVINRPPNQTSLLESQLDHWQAQQQELPPLHRHRHVREQINNLEVWVSDQAFVDIPKKKQEQALRQLDELKAYDNYQERLAQITDPREATSLGQLHEIEKSLAQINVPAPYQNDWRQTDAGIQHANSLQDAQAIDETVIKALERYHKLIEDGKQVLDNAAQANLPARARKVLEKAHGLALLEQEPDKLLPGASRASYATVFGFKTVIETRHKWNEIQKKLEPFAKLEMP